MADTYRINELIGKGGMAFVYSATQAAIRRQVALKIIRPRLLADEDTVRRFVMEARTAGRIPAHPNIVTVYEAGIVEPHGVPFLAMELCPGQTLRARIDARGALPWPEVNTLLDQLGEGLDAAHAAGVVHRDLNPGNIMVHEDHKARSRVKLLDFGIAQFAEDARSRTATTIGTPSYSAPEQFGSRVRSLAASKGFVVDGYEDEAVGHLEKNAAGKMAVTRVELHPKVSFGGSKQPAPADLDWLHDKAHKECFIANSVTTDVRVAGHSSS